MVRTLPRASIILTAILLVAAFVAPLPYVVIEPGEPQNALGKIEKGEKKNSKELIELIEIKGTKTFPTKGKLNLTSIYVSSPDSKIYGFDVMSAWFDGETSVQPRAVFFPEGVSVKEFDQQNALDMQQSQEDAKVSALEYLGYTIPERLIIAEITKASPNNGILQKNDEILKLNGVDVGSASNFKKQVAALAVSTAASDQIQLSILRKKVKFNVKVRTYKISKKQKVLGLIVKSKFDYPFSIKIRLKDVGGPSAGMIFSLGIIEKLTAEDLIRGRNISGTGTIDAQGQIGPIGGIEEKLIGAARAGSKLFLAPALNCENIRHIPKGLQVVAVESISEAVSALKNRDLEALPACG